MVMTVAFFGAGTGVGLSALKHTLEAGHNCVALCRVPSKLTGALSDKSYPNLKIIEGNAHNVDQVSECLKKDDGTLVDKVVSTIGGKPIGTSWGKIKTDDPHVSENGMFALLGALKQLRSNGATGRPHIVICSSTGASQFSRDVPLLMVPVYKYSLELPRKDKMAMEALLVASGEDFSIARASALVDGATEKPIRVGIEDPKNGRESEAIGYTISREDAGKWIAQNLVLVSEPKYLNKMAMITY